LPDVSPYGVTQNADAARTTADALVGTPIPQTTGNSIVGGPAFLSTAPYKPRTKPPPRTYGCTGRDGTCRVPVLTGTDMCLFHTRQTEAQARKEAGHSHPPVA
jgi:hypothetical protein